MSLFKKRVSEEDAVCQFIEDVLEATNREWPEIMQAIQKHFSLWNTEYIPPKESAKTYYGLAKVFLHVASLPKYMPEDQAIRIRGRVMQYFSKTKAADLALKSLQDYQDAVDTEIEEHPGSLSAKSFIDAISLVLGFKMGYQPYPSFSKAALFGSPIDFGLLNALAIALADEPPWWKFATEKCELIP